MDIGVIGLGLIGGSLLRAAAERGRPEAGGAANRRPVSRVTGYDASAETRAAARRAGYDIADSVTELFECELLVLAVPLPALPGLLPELSGFHGLLTDVTSVKRPVCRLVAEHCPGVRFVAGHPMAGKETSGFDASDAGLFHDRVWVLCLDDGTDLDDWILLAELVCDLGARVVPATAAEHDSAAARISHVPHVAAAALTLLAADPLSRAMGAGSFADGTRVAQTRPELAAAMCVGNAEPVRAELDRLIAGLTAARDRLADAGRFRDWYAAAGALRTDWPPAAGDIRDMPVSAQDLLSLGRAGGWITAVDHATGSVTVKRPAARLA